jgi:acyl-CoA thioesterase I
MKPMFLSKGWRSGLKTPNFRWVVFSFTLMALHAAATSDAPVIVIFGDSLAAGYGLAQNSGWVALLQDRLRERKFKHRVINASLSGETTQGGRTRIAQVLSEHRPDLLILELGGNDGLRGLPLASMRENLEAIIEAATKVKAQVLLLGIQLPPNYGRTYTQKFQAVYADLVTKFDLRFVPYLLQGLGEGRDSFQVDGIHPNAAAQPRILDNVWRELEPCLRSALCKRGTL